MGADGLMLLDDGVRWDGCYDGCDGDTCRNPRSAAGTDATGQYLWLIVVDGRRSGALGMTCSEVRDLAQDLGCWGTVLGWCTGGRLVGQGDCAYYGATCQEDAGWAFCVDSRCPGGDGMGATCLDATRVASCTDGVYGEGDCAAFGLVCGEDAHGDEGCVEAGGGDGGADGGEADGGAADGGAGDGGGTGADGAGTDGGGATPGEGNRGQSYDPQDGCACGGGAPTSGLLLPGLLLARRRRRQS